MSIQGYSDSLDTENGNKKTTQSKSRNEMDLLSDKVKPSGSDFERWV